MKKLTRKLLISVLSVALALVALGTQTFAWFAMNDTVTAKNMTVEVKSDQMFLLIQSGHVTSSGVIQTSAKIEDDAAVPSAALLPTANRLNSSANIEEVEATSGANLKNWYYMTSNDPSSYVGSGAQKDITSSAMDKYVLVNEFSLTVAKGSNNLSNLQVKTVTISGDVAVKVLVAGSEGSEEFAGTGEGHNVLCSTLTDSTVENVKIYIYWDGDHSDVYTNNIANLENTTVTVTFTGEVVE